MPVGAGRGHIGPPVEEDELAVATELDAALDELATELELCADDETVLVSATLTELALAPPTPVEEDVIEAPPYPLPDVAAVAACSDVLDADAPPWAATPASIGGGGGPNRSDAVMPHPAMITVSHNAKMFFMLDISLTGDLRAMGQV